MAIDISVDMRTSLGLARRFSPQDTGNAKFNATKAFMNARGFRINYSLNDAFYIYFLEEGTRKSMQHQGYIANQTVPAIAHFLNVKYNHRSKAQLKRLYGMAWNGNLDRATDSTLERRTKRQEASLNYDLETNSNLKGKQWQHNANIENNSNEWERVDYL